MPVLVEETKKKEIKQKTTIVYEVDGLSFGTREEAALHILKGDIECLLLSDEALMNLVKGHSYVDDVVREIAAFLAENQEDVMEMYMDRSRRVGEL